MADTLFYESIVNKKGTVDLDMVETTPFTYQGELYLFEYVREGYEKNTTNDSFFQITHVKTGTPLSSFAKGYHLGSAFVENQTVYCFGVNQWNGDTISCFWSDDLIHWSQREVLYLEGFGMFNTSVCKRGNEYVMAFEVGKPPEETGQKFTMRFAVSDDLHHFTVLPRECAYSFLKYSACGTIRYFDGYLYMVYLECVKDSDSPYGVSWQSYIVRSKDLMVWEETNSNPVLKHSEKDKMIANPNLTLKQRERIEKACNVNNSDFDFCEFENKTIIYYSWGNQHGNEFLAYAEYNGSMESFLKEFF